MKHNGHNEQSAAVMSLCAHQFDGLIIIYFDAEGLKRGFQLWLGWPGGAERLRNCIPIYFARNVVPRALDERLRASCGDTLVLLCLSRDGSFSSRNIEALAAVLQQDKVVRRALVVLFTNSRSCATWRRQWPLPGSLEFPLGSFTVSPIPRPDDIQEDSSLSRYDLHAVSHGKHASGRLRGCHARAPSANHGQSNP